MRKTKLTIFLTVISFALFGMAGVASAAEYYVSPTGTATWTNCAGPTPLNGASACSWQTANDNATAGDIVYFRAGTYEPGTSKNPAYSGTAENYITFTAYPGENVIIHDAASGPAVNVQGYAANNKHHIIFDGFIFDRDKDTGLGASSIFRIEDANNIIIKNSEMIGRPHRDHTNGTVISILHSSYVYIHNNKLHGVSADPNPIEAVVNASAIWFFDKDNIYIYNNDIYDNYRGISTKVDGSHLYIYNNHFYNNTSAAVVIAPQTSGNTDFIIHNNVVRNCGAFVSATDVVANPYYNLKVYNNTVYHSGATSGVIIGSYSYNRSRNAEVFNNIFSFGGANSLFVNYWPGASFPIYADNNLFYGPGRWSYGYQNYSTSLSAWRTASGADMVSITDNPNFINAGGANPADYKRTSYPAGGRGGAYASVMGAYITGDEIIGYVAPTQTDITPPSAPSGLAVL